jgi:hypothetical protein
VNKKTILKFVLLLLFSLIFVLSSCTSDSKKTGDAISADIGGQQNLKQEEKKPVDLYINKPAINASADKKTEEVFNFVVAFIKTLDFPSVEGYPSQPDSSSFQLVGLIVDSNEYTTITHFQLNTMKGQMKKQYTISVRDLGNGNYVPINVREDK